MEKSNNLEFTSGVNPAWWKTLTRYQQPDLQRSWWQVINSLVPYLVIWAIMVWSLQVSYWLTLLLAIPAAGFMVRIFIIFHDCGHGSFFKSRRTNDVLGIITGILTFTPYYHWRHNHAVHHATVGNLDRRGVGDVMTLTVKEYEALPGLKKLGYRIMRNPLILFTVGAPGVFLIGHRFSSGKASKRERFSVYWTNLALAGIVVLMSLTIGIKAYVLVQLPILVLGTVIGVWLFYVQHQFEHVYWERNERWDFVAASLQGSSFYKLPRVLQWFTGNIGYHHVHHISPRIPNYFLEKCHNAHPELQEVEPLTFIISLKSLFLRLWDEERKLLVGFGELNRIPRSARTT